MFNLDQKYHNGRTKTCNVILHTCVIYSNYVQIYLDSFTSVLYDQFTSRMRQHSCLLVTDEVDNARGFICDSMVMSLNTFWFSLALCLIFFIPSVLFSVTLSKYYRRTKKPEMLWVGSEI